MLCARIGDADTCRKTTMRDSYLGESAAEFNDEVTWQINAEVNAAVNTEVNVRFDEDINAGSVAKFTGDRVIDFLHPCTSQGRNTALCAG